MRETIPVSGKELVPRIYREFLQPDDNNTNNPIRKWAKDLDRHCCKAHTQTAKKPIKQYSPSRVTTRTRTKTLSTVRGLHGPASRRQTVVSADEDAGKSEPSHTLVGWKTVQLLWGQPGTSLCG